MIRPYQQPLHSGSDYETLLQGQRISFLDYNAYVSVVQEEDARKVGTIVFIPCVGPETIILKAKEAK